ncbi:MAG: plastocyanin/azurin family copper-binding protein [Opitutales bacterium]
MLVLSAGWAGCNGESEAAKPTAKPSAITVAADGTHEITLTGDDTKRYNVSRLEVPPGAKVRLSFTNTGKMPRATMAHNFVLVADAQRLPEFIVKAALAGEPAYLPEGFDDYILASTKMAGPGETVNVTFTAPEQPGGYPFVCTFPAHFDSGMQGVLVVTGDGDS